MDRHYLSIYVSIYARDVEEEETGEGGADGDEDYIDIIHLSIYASCYLSIYARDVEEEETGEGGADGDEDWIEPGKITSRRKRDKNSPKR